MPRWLLAPLCALLLSSCGAAPAATLPPPVFTPTPLPANPSATPPLATPAAPAQSPTQMTALPMVSDNRVTDLAALRFGLKTVAAGFRQPVYLTEPADGSGRLFVVEQDGTIRIVRDGAVLPTPFLDIREQVGSDGTEQGLLSVAFHPKFAANGQFFVNYTDRGGDTVISRFTVSAQPDLADSATEQLILKIDQPAGNHNGGLVKFGPDGYLYIGMGDGGRGGDPWNNAQTPSALLGKMLRIDVDSAQPYAIPKDNPFVGEVGTAAEIWALGLRNPWRFSFDRATGDLFIADVGQNAWEEVSVQPAGSRGGENYGWRPLEGDRCYNAERCDSAGYVAPIAVYGHDQGCSVTGGYVYRGAQFPQIAGVYFYADFCSGYLWGLRQIDGEWQSLKIAELSARVASFGEDQSGELYVVDHQGAIAQLVVEN